MDVHIVPMSRMTAIVGRGRNAPTKLDLKTDAGAVRLFAGEVEAKRLATLIHGANGEVRWSVPSGRGDLDVVMTRKCARAIAGLLDIGVRKAA